MCIYIYIYIYIYILYIYMYIVHIYIYCTYIYIYIYILYTGGHNGREGKGPGTPPSGWADAGSNPGSSNEG